MQRMLRTILPVLFPLWPVATAAADQRPIPQDPKRQEQRFQDMLAWNKRTLRGAYERVGKKSPRWDGLALPALDYTAHIFSHVLEPNLRFNSVYATASMAVDKGCDDPLILYIYARSSCEENDPGPKELDRRYSAAAAALEGSAYPPFRISHALATAAKVKANRKYATSADQKEAERLVDAAIAFLSRSAEEDEPTPDLRSIWYTVVIDAIDVYTKLTGDDKTAIDRVDAELAKTPALRALRLKAKGSVYVRYAWKARGGDTADTVTEEGWRLFAERLKVARRALEESWKLQPDDPMTATRMMWVIIGEGSGRAEMEKWFERAMSADGNCYLACAAKLDWLDPKWYGSREEMLAFGRACRDTGNWRTGITLLVAEAHARIMKALPTEAERNEYMRRPEVWKEIDAVYRDCLKHDYANYGVRARFAVLCYLGGWYAESDHQFKLADDHFHWDWWMYSERWMKDVRTFVAKYVAEQPSAAAPDGKTTPPPKQSPAKTKDATQLPNQPAAKSENTDPSAKEVSAKAKSALRPDDASRSREFPEQNCRFTLPSVDWSWAETPTGGTGILCKAKNKRGFTFLLSAVRMTDVRVAPAEFNAEEYERGYYGSTAGQFTKRGGHFATMDGRRWYQAESLAKDGRTSAHRAIFADGVMYNLLVIGGKQPVERDPDFERAMSGFAFMTTPAQPAANSNPAATDKPDLPYRMGQVAAYATIAAVAVGVVSLLARKKRRPARRESEDDRAFAEAIRPGSSRNSVPADLTAPPDQAIAKYRRGMKDLGRGLIALALLNILIGGGGLALAQNKFLGGLLVAVGGLYLFLGFFALRTHGWVNYVVAAWATLLLGLNLIAISGQSAETSQPLGCLMFLVPGALLYFSIKNLSAWGSVKATNVEA